MNIEQTSSPISNFKLVSRWTVFGHSALFVLGFSLVFIVGWGGAATLLGQLFSSYKSLIGKIGGLVVILFGLSNLGLLRMPWLLYDTRPEWMPRSSGGVLSSLSMGVFFAAGWTPCIGTTLGAILTLGLSQDRVSQAMVLSSGYALGMGIPFLILGLGMERAVRLITRFRKHVRWVEITSGVLMVALGLLMLFDRMNVIAIWGLRHRLFIDLPLTSASAPTYMIAVAAGLLSFLSPCVLPLVPAYIGYLSGKMTKPR